MDLENLPCLLVVVDKVGLISLALPSRSYSSCALFYHRRAKALEKENWVKLWRGKMVPKAQAQVDCGFV